jgi:hypothetical protein
MSSGEAGGSEHRGHCAQCAGFRSPIAIGGPGELGSVIALVRQAVRDGVLEDLGPMAEAAMVAQPSFLELKRGQSLPDVLQYGFACRNCGQRFVLTVDTYHGAAGFLLELAGDTRLADREQSGPAVSDFDQGARESSANERLQASRR